MRFIVIGCLGSMGRRRIRNLKALAHTDIIGYDLVDYKKANSDCWYIDMLDEVENFLENPTGEGEKIDGIIVSTPPLTKQPYIDLANKYSVPCFAEADVTLYNGEYFCSSTMRFHPAIQKIKELLDSGTLGKVYTFTYHCGNHIEDWHPGVDMKTYYAAKKETGGCKEIFPFELSWLSYLLGTPVNACGIIDKKFDDLDISADDVYSTVVRFENIYLPPQNMPIHNRNIIEYKNLMGVKNSITGTILVDILSRPAIRELRIIGSKCNLLWNWDDSFITIDFPNGVRMTEDYDKGKAAEGYNENICEDMYVEEMRAFITATEEDKKPLCTQEFKKHYPYTKAEEEAVISMLRKVEGNNG